MDKAIEIIRDYMKIVTTVSTQYHVSECKEAIAELQAHKAKIEELKEWAIEQIEISTTGIHKEDKRHNIPGLHNYIGVKAACDTILQKLEELDK